MQRLLYKGNACYINSLTIYKRLNLCTLNSLNFLIAIFIFNKPINVIYYGDLWKKNSTVCVSTFSKQKKKTELFIVKYSGGRNSIKKKFCYLKKKFHKKLKSNNSGLLVSHCTILYLLF